MTIRVSNPKYWRKNKDTATRKKTPLSTQPAKRTAKSLKMASSAKNTPVIVNNKEEETTASEPIVETPRSRHSQSAKNSDHSKNDIEVIGVVVNENKENEKPPKTGIKRSLPKVTEANPVDNKNAKLDEASKPLSGGESSDSEAEPAADLEQIQQEIVKLSKIISKIPLNHLDNVKKGELQALEVAVDNMKFALEQNEHTERTTLDSWIGTLKKYTKILKDIQDRYSDQEKTLGSVLERISKLETDVSGIKQNTDKYISAIIRVDGFVAGFQMTTASRSGPLVHPTEGAPEEFAKPKKYCVLCENNTHNSMACGIYSDFQARSKRGQVLGICKKCLQKCDNSNSGVHTNCPMDNTVCPNCSKVMSDTAVTNHHKLFCSFTGSTAKNLRKQQASGQNKNGGAGQHLQGMFNNNHH